MDLRTAKFLEPSQQESMDKSWVHKDRWGKDYQDGVRMEDNHQEPRAKKARGKGKLGFLNDLKDGDKVQVELYCGCPTGETRKHLGHYIGFLAKDGRMLPLSVSYWKYMAPARIEAATQEIKHIFEYPEILDDKIINKLNLSWKAHKSNMKKQGFDVNRTREENLAHRPEGVVGSQWAPLVEMWESEENQCKIWQNLI
ncbi:hypothetical protein C5167_030474 [Papaver somniferum]|nr:hypothetical protein C5167_030474 [Papaver somniferum]